MNAIYVFDVEGEGKWHVDLSGSGIPTLLYKYSQQYHCFKKKPFDTAFIMKNTNGFG